MAKKHNRKPENGSAAPSFRTDTKLEKAFLSILDQNTAPEEVPSDKEDDSLSAPIDLLPGTEPEVPVVSAPAELSPEEASDKTDEAIAEAAGESEVIHALKDFMEGLNLDVVPAGTANEKPVPETKASPDRAAETEKRPEAEKAPAPVPPAAPTEAPEEAPLQAPKASRAPESRKKRRRTLPVHETALSGKNTEKPLPDEKSVSEAKKAPAEEPVSDPEPVSEQKPVPEPETAFPGETSPEREPAVNPKTASDPLLVFKAEIASDSDPVIGAETVSEADYILDPDALFAPDPEPESVPAPEAIPEPEIAPETASEVSDDAAFSAPFLRSSEKISSFALDFFIAALPLLGARIWYFGWRTVTVLLTSLAVCLFSELVFALIARKDPPSALKDRNFAVTALTVTLISSPNLPLWSVAALSALAVILFRGIFGLRTSTVRSHPLNPAMAAFSLLLLFWHALDRFGAVPGVRAPLLLASPDPAAYGVGNPILSSLREGVLPAVSPVSFVFGNAAGLLPMLFVLFALVYLLVRKTVPWQIPAAMIFSGILFAALLPRTAIRTDMLLLQSVLFEICSGTFLLCALFCGADTATVPYTGTGKLVFGFLAGAFTILLRHYTGIVNCAPIGVVAANALTPLINRFTVPRPFGGK